MRCSSRCALPVMASRATAATVRASIAAFRSATRRRRKPGSPSTAGMMLTFAFPDGRRWVSRAGLYRYDNDYIAVGYGNASDVPAIMAAVAGARDPIEVGLAAGSSPPQTWTADARGSTAAARKFLDNCFPTN